jgi:hypothetical protein
MKQNLSLGFSAAISQFPHVMKGDNTLAHYRMRVLGKE